MVTGGSGFIGTHFIRRLLQDGHEIIIFDKAPSSDFDELCVIGDVRDEQALKEAADGVDVIVHLAAEHHDNVSPLSLYTETNIEGTKNVASAAEAVGCKKIVFTSSVAVYPLNASTPTEDADPAPFNEYGRTKLEAEKVLKRWATSDPDRTAVIIRPSVVFGERNRGNVYNLLQQIQKGRFVMVGNGENRKSMAYVGNLVEFMLLSLSMPSGVSLFNYADKPDLNTKQIVEVASDYFSNSRFLSNAHVPYGLGLFVGRCFDAASRVSGRTFPISSIRIRKFAADTTVSADRARSTGFEPSVPLEEALARTLEAEFQQ